MSALSHHVPITLLCDLADPAGPASGDINRHECDTERDACWWVPRRDAATAGAVDGSAPEPPA
jgi:hypothetical protein